MTAPAPASCATPRNPDPFPSARVLLEQELPEAVMGEGVKFGEAHIQRAPKGWRVLIPTTSGEVLEYAYRTRRSARYFAAVFRLGPTWFPRPDRITRPASSARTEMPQIPTGQVA